ncbi:MAG: polysaccharide deacetylase family protein [Anaerolineaceae bacterium]|nr:polysaccharide deacetylase family protein [Anaerolineaceae bacterium]
MVVPAADIREEGYVFTVDDIGMCQATIPAYEDLDTAGAVSSGAVMVPCPWFLLAAESACNHPQTDLGIHLTITSEWKNYRWGPISTRDLESGLIDEEGFFYHWFEEAKTHGKPHFVAIELEAQIQRALTAGMQPTHVDSHMFALVHPKFLEVYLETAYRFGLPAMMARWGVAEWQRRGMETEVAERAEKMLCEYEEQGYPLLDLTTGLKPDRFDNRLEQAKQALPDLPKGLSHFYIHPSKDTPELQAITPDWPGRVADYQVFLDGCLQQHIKNIRIQVIGYRSLLGIMPVTG